MTDENTTVETPAVETPAAESTPAPVETPEASPTGQEPAAEVAPAYEPNLKFRVHDKDYELDSFLKDAIKDADTEKKLKQIYEKAYGFDVAKPKHLETQGRLQGLEQGINSLAKLVEEDKMSDFLDFWKIPKQKMFEYVAKELQYLELEPAQRAEIDRQKALEREASQSQTQLQQMQQVYNQQMASLLGQQLDMAVSRADVTEAVGEFDSRVGRPGAFRDEVIRRGRDHFNRTGKNLSVDDAVKEVMTILGYAEVNDSTASQQSKKVMAPVQQKKLPVIPNMGSGGASPVKKAIKSLDDLREMRRKQANA